ncbi:MAG TPA: SCO family protein [Polyangiaceae bacterium]|nr:SCO family protein [Polyangiaceae bacterium]
MKNQAWLRLAAAFAFTVACATLSCASPTYATPPQPNSPEVGVDEHLGARLPLERRFTTSQGQQVELGRVVGNGKPTLLVLAYNRCTMLCNLVLRGTADVVHRLNLQPGRDYNAVTISIDPRELPGEASRTQQMLLVKAGYSGQAERWPFLVGRQPDIDAVAGALGFRYHWDARSEQYAHPAVLFVLSPEGQVRAYFYGLKHDPNAIEQALRHASPARPATVAASVLSCFRFDTLSQKYGGRIRYWFQAGSAFVLLGLLVGISRLWRRAEVPP